MSDDAAAGEAAACVVALGPLRWRPAAIEEGSCGAGAESTEPSVTSELGEPISRTGEPRSEVSAGRGGELAALPASEDNFAASDGRAQAATPLSPKAVSLVVPSLARAPPSRADIAHKDGGSGGMLTLSSPVPPFPSAGPSATTEAEVRTAAPAPPEPPPRVSTSSSGESKDERELPAPSPAVASHGSLRGGLTERERGGGLTSTLRAAEKLVDGPPKRTRVLLRRRVRRRPRALVTAMAARPASSASNEVRERGMLAMERWRASSGKARGGGGGVGAARPRKESTLATAACTADVVEVHMWRRNVRSSPSSAPGVPAAGRRATAAACAGSAPQRRDGRRGGVAVRSAISRRARGRAAWRCLPGRRGAGWGAGEWGAAAAGLGERGS